MAGGRQACELCSVACCVAVVLLRMRAQAVAGSLDRACVAGRRRRCAAPSPSVLDPAVPVLAPAGPAGGAARQQRSSRAVLGTAGCNHRRQGRACIRPTVCRRDGQGIDSQELAQGEGARQGAAVHHPSHQLQAGRGSSGSSGVECCRAAAAAATRTAEQASKPSVFLPSGWSWRLWK